MFRNLESLFYEVKNTLLDSENLRKLVYYNTQDALTRPAPTYAEASTAIYLKPIIYVYDESPEHGLSTFVSIGLVETLVLGGSLKSVLKVSVACQRSIWELDSNRVRPLAIISEISNSLDGVKLKAAGKLEMRIVKEVYFNNDLVGYTVLFDIAETKGDVVNDF